MDIQKIYENAIEFGGEYMDKFIREADKLIDIFLLCEDINEHDDFRQNVRLKLFLACSSKVDNIGDYLTDVLYDCSEDKDSDDLSLESCNAYYTDEECFRPIENKILHETFEKLFKKIKPRSVDALLLYYGSDRTLRQVGKILGVTTERVRQLCVKGLRDLRRPNRARYLCGFRDDIVDYGIYNKSNKDYIAKRDEFFDSWRKEHNCFDKK